MFWATVFHLCSSFSVWNLGEASRRAVFSPWESHFEVWLWEDNRKHTTVPRSYCILYEWPTTSEWKKTVTLKGDFVYMYQNGMEFPNMWKYSTVNPLKSEKVLIPLHNLFLESIHKNKGNDQQLRQLLMVLQILLVRT